jgi:hypothetical protein
MNRAWRYEEYGKLTLHISVSKKINDPNPVFYLTLFVAHKCGVNIGCPQVEGEKGPELRSPASSDGGTGE